MQFLALVADATNEAKHREAFLRGVDYILAAQYPNGGWPQFWPLRGGYYDHITFNDGAKMRIMSVLRDTARGNAPYGFVDVERRNKSAAAVERGLNCILKTQIRREGRLTGWCAQHEELTLAPALARKYEPPSLSGAESIGIASLLLAIEQPSPEIVGAVDGAVEWFRTVPIKGFRVDDVKNAEGQQERILVADPSAPLLWARFYELRTNHPLYMDRDSQPVYHFAQIDRERRSGYGYHGYWPANLVERDYPAWKATLPTNATTNRSAR